MGWHALWVHAPLVWWPLGTVFLIMSWVWTKQAWQRFAWVTLTLAAGSAILASLSGQSALSGLHAESQQLIAEHQQWGNLLPWLMMIILVLRGHCGLRGIKLPVWLWILPSLLVCWLLWHNAILGTRAVFSLGLELPLDA